MYHIKKKCKQRKEQASMKSKICKRCKTDSRIYKFVVPKLERERAILTTSYKTRFVLVPDMHLIKDFVEA